MGLSIRIGEKSLSIQRESAVGLLESLPPVFMRCYRKIGIHVLLQPLSRESIVAFHRRPPDFTQSPGDYLTDIPLHAVKTQQDAEGLSDALDR